MALTSAVHTLPNNRGTLTPRGKLTASKPKELIVNGTLVTDTLGGEIDGNDDGQAGSDYIATITGSRVTPCGISLASVRRRPANIGDVIDHLLARGELAMRCPRNGGHRETDPVHL